MIGLNVLFVLYLSNFKMDIFSDFTSKWRNFKNPVIRFHCLLFKSSIQTYECRNIVIEIYFVWVSNLLIQLKSLRIAKRGKSCLSSTLLFSESKSSTPFFIAFFQIWSMLFMFLKKRGNQGGDSKGSYSLKCFFILIRVSKNRMSLVFLYSLFKWILLSCHQHSF